MLAVAPLRNPRDEAAVGEPNFSIINDEFPDLSGDNLLDSIDFDDLFNGMEDEDHVLPALEMESDDIFAEFSVSGGEEPETNNNNASSNLYVENFDNISSRCYNQQEEADKVSGSDFGSDSSKLNQVDDQIVAAKVPRANKEDAKRNKSSKNQQGKRKVKVDWTPELHRRFVQAVEQLGVDKAVPSRILELMGIDCLTRHNIASHLQKYRSHRKHLLAREAEAANWSQRRQAYGAATGGGRGCKREMSNTNPWVAPTIGFPPIAPNNLPHFRPLHVWGHPSIEQPLMPVWPAKHLAPSHPPPPPMWPPSAAAPHLPPQPPDLSLWHSRYQRIGHSKITRTHGFPPSMAPARFAGPVPGMPPMYKVDPVSAPPHPPFDFHPSKECIDAAIGDVISKPWLPLPLGLKPPSTDSVVVELHRQGVENIPPTATCASTT